MSDNTSQPGRLSSVVRDMPPSGIRKFFDLVIGMDDVVSLGVGEPDFTSPLSVRNEAIKVIQEGRTSYTSNYGLMELREAIAEWLQAKYAISYNPANEIVITVGASEALDLALRAILNPGDEVIVLQPCYVSYGPNVALAGGVPIYFSTHQEDGFRANLDELEKVITPRTKAIMLNYPNNPGGFTFDKSDLEALAAFITKHNLIAISDEIYAELTYDKKHTSLASLPGMKDRTIVINGFSKSHAMTGWRLGYLCAPEDLATGMLKIHQYTMLCAPTVSQYAGIDALKNGENAVAEMLAQYKDRRDLIVKGFNSLGLKTLLPEGAFYAFANIKDTVYSSEDFCNQLLADQKVAVVPGNAFGVCGEGFIRASYASSLEKIELAIERMGKFLKK